MKTRRYRTQYTDPGATLDPHGFRVIEAADRHDAAVSRVRQDGWPRDKTTVFVAVADPGAPLHANGCPMVIHVIELKRV